jgi:hypothetical protein
MWYVAGAVAVIAVCEALVIVRLSRALGSAARFGDRIGHLTSALELLTDTTETGMANVAAELQRGTPARATRQSRAATAKRISSAVRRGLPLEDIAANEALSESEVHLHMQLTPQPRSETGRHGAVR